MLFGELGPHLETKLKPGCKGAQRRSGRRMACLQGCESCSWQCLDGRLSDPRPHRVRPWASAKGELQGDVCGQNEAGSRWWEESAHHVGSFQLRARGEGTWSDKRLSTKAVDLHPQAVPYPFRHYRHQPQGPGAFQNLQHILLKNWLQNMESKLHNGYC